MPSHHIRPNRASVPAEDTMPGHAQSSAPHRAQCAAVRVFLPCIFPLMDKHLLPYYLHSHWFPHPYGPTPIISCPVNVHCLLNGTACPVTTKRWSNAYSPTNWIIPAIPSRTGCATGTSRDIDSRARGITE